MHNTVLNVVKRHGQSESSISSICGPYLAEAKKSYYINNFDCFTILTAHYDTYIFEIY